MATAASSVPAAGQRRPPPLIFLEPGLAVGMFVRDDPTVRAGRLGSLTFNAGLIDRTGKLDFGFPTVAADPIPDPNGPAADRTIAELCDERGAAIVAEARRTGRPIRLLWSGGIDSTAAAIAIMKALGEDTEALEIVLNRFSILEYRRFFAEHVKRYPRARVAHITEVIRPDAQNVTGECGDQLFGCALTMHYSPPALSTPWREMLPVFFSCDLLGTGARATECTDFFSAHLEAAPVPLVSFFDALWWLNFSLKWNAVCFRIVAMCDLAKIRINERVVDHFYRTEDFQVWSMTHPYAKIGETHETYKWPLKQYIFDYTGDDVYLSTKRKEPGLRGNMSPKKSQRDPVGIDVERNAWCQPFDATEKSQASTHTEYELWSEVGYGGKWADALKPGVPP